MGTEKTQKKKKKRVIITNKYKSRKSLKVPPTENHDKEQ